MPAKTTKASLSPELATALRCWTDISENLLDSIRPRSERDNELFDHLRKHGQKLRELLRDNGS